LSMFTTLGDADRTNMITRLLGFEKYDDLYDIFKSGVSDSCNLADDMRDRIESLNTEIKIVETKYDGIKDQMTSINDANDNLKKRIVLYKSELVTLNESMHKLNDKNDAEVDISGFDTEIQKLMGMEDDANRTIDKLRVKSKKFSEDISNNQSRRMEKVTELRGYQVEISRLNNDIKHLNNSHFGERCDKCASTITVENIGIFVAEKEKKISEFDEQINNHTSAVETYDKETSEIEVGKKEVDSQINSHDPRIIKIEIIEVNQRKDNAVLLSRAIEVERTRITTSITNKEESVYNLESDVHNEEDKFSKLNHQTMALDKDIHDKQEQIKLITSQIDEAVKLTEIQEFWKNAFSPTGIRSLLIDRFCNEFNRIANEYLSTASNGVMSVTMTPTKTLKSGEERNKLGFDIMMGNDLVKYASLSGGEKRRVDSSICLSINKWISMRLGVKHGLLGIMVLDELFSGIDEMGAQSIATLLNNEGKQKAVFVIDHALGLSSYADRIIEVVKINGVSHLENAV